MRRLRLFGFVLLALFGYFTLAAQDADSLFKGPMSDAIDVTSLVSFFFFGGIGALAYFFKFSLFGMPMIIAAIFIGLSAAGVTAIWEELGELFGGGSVERRSPTGGLDLEAEREKAYGVIQKIVGKYAADEDGIDLVMEGGVRLLNVHSQPGGLFSADQGPPSWFSGLVNEVNEITVSHSGESMGGRFDEYVKQVPDHIWDWVHAQVGNSWDNLT